MYKVLLLLSLFIPSVWADIGCKKDDLDSFYLLNNSNTIIPHNTEVTVTCATDYYVEGDINKKTFQTTCRNGFFENFRFCKKKSCTNNQLANLMNSAAATTTGTTYHNEVVSVTCSSGYYVEGEREKTNYMAVCNADNNTFLLKKCVKKCTSVFQLGKISSIIYKDSNIIESSCKTSNVDDSKANCYLEADKPFWVVCAEGFRPEPKNDLAPDCPNGTKCFENNCVNGMYTKVSYCILDSKPPETKAELSVGNDLTCSVGELNFIPNRLNIVVRDPKGNAVSMSRVDENYYANVTCRASYEVPESHSGELCSPGQLNCFKTTCKYGKWTNIGNCVKKCSFRNLGGNLSVFKETYDSNIRVKIYEVGSDYLTTKEQFAEPSASQYLVQCDDGRGIVDKTLQTSYYTQCQDNGNFTAIKLCRSDYKACAYSDIIFQSPAAKPANFNVSDTASHGTKFSPICSGGNAAVAPDIITCYNGKWIDGNFNFAATTSMPTPPEKNYVTCQSGCVIPSDDQNNDQGFFRNGAKNTAISVLDASSGSSVGTASGGSVIKHGQVISVSCVDGYTQYVDESAERSGQKYRGIYNACYNGKWSKKYVTCVQMCSKENITNDHLRFVKIASEPIKSWYNIGADLSSVTCNDGYVSSYSTQALSAVGFDAPAPLYFEDCTSNIASPTSKWWSSDCDGLKQYIIKYSNVYGSASNPTSWYSTLTRQQFVSVDRDYGQAMCEKDTAKTTPASSDGDEIIKTKVNGRLYCYAKCNLQLTYFTMNNGGIFSYETNVNFYEGQMGRARLYWLQTNEQRWDDGDEKIDYCVTMKICEAIETCDKPKSKSVNCDGRFVNINLYFDFDQDSNNASPERRSVEQVWNESYNIGHTFLYNYREENKLSERALNEGLYNTIPNIVVNEKQVQGFRWSDTDCWGRPWKVL